MMHQFAMSKTTANSFFPVWIRQRELKQRSPLGNSDVFYKNLYSSITRCHFWGGRETSRSEHGGLFCLEFSPDGSLLVAGCEKDSFLNFDPLSQKWISTVHNAHTSCVTNVKFLDSRIFATGSVDRTVCLWDTRNLKSQIRTFRGHSSTIGNIEFSSKNNFLITSGVDGYVSIWDMNNSSPAEEISRKKLRPYALLRLRLNPDESKMIISTSMGYLMIVHELDLYTLAQDLNEFETFHLEIFGFEYLKQTTASRCQNWSPFSPPNRRRNRVEIVGDFPNVGGCHVISALEIHPQGWSAFSRSTSKVSGQEWICVHDIRKEPPKSVPASREGSRDECPPCPQHVDAGRAKRYRLDRTNESRSRAREDTEGIGSFGRASVGFCMPSSNYFCSEVPDAAFSQERGVRKRRSDSPADTARARSPPSPPPGPSSGPPDTPNISVNSSDLRTDLDHSLPRPNSSVSQCYVSVQESFPRLTHFVEEPNSSKWYVSSLGVSADGRLVCSPLECGIKLLAFSPECSEQSDSSFERKPRRLHELSTHISHSERVICTKFSPRHCLIVSGCLGGKLAWYQPVV